MNKHAPMNRQGHVVLSPSATAADGAALASRVGVGFEKKVKIRIAISEARAPEPEKWEFRPDSATVVSAWAGDVQLHLGSIFAAVMKMRGKGKTEKMVVARMAAHAVWNCFEINPKLIMKLIHELRLYDAFKGKTVNIENLIGLQYSCSSPGSGRIGIGDVRKIGRYAEIVETRSDTTLQFLKDFDRVLGGGSGWMEREKKVENFLKKTRKLSYEEAVYMVERELKVCRLAARELLTRDRHWSYYQWSAGTAVKVNDQVYQQIPYQPKFKD